MISPELGSWRCLTIYCKLKTRLWVFLRIVINYSCQTQEDPPCCLQSLLRSQRQARHGEPDGNLLKAGSERTPKTINVEFTGTRTDDPATGMSNAKSMVIFDYEGRTTQVFLFYMAVSLKDWDLPNSRNQWFCACVMNLRHFISHVIPVHFDSTTWNQGTLILENVDRMVSFFGIERCHLILSLRTYLDRQAYWADVHSCDIRR